MGHIVKLRFSYDDRQWLDSLIRSAPFFSSYNPEYQLYEFRDPERTDADPTPNFAVKIEEDGLWCSAYGNQQLMQEVDTYLVTGIQQNGHMPQRIL
jgi:hypothetical protein